MKNQTPKNNNILPYVCAPTQEQIWQYIQASPERLERLQEIAYQAFIAEYIGPESRRFVNASVKSSYYFLELANEIGDKCQLQEKKIAPAIAA